MIVPFFSVVPDDKNEIIAGIFHIMSDVFEFYVPHRSYSHLHHLRIQFCGDLETIRYRIQL